MLLIQDLLFEANKVGSKSHTNNMGFFYCATTFSSDLDFLVVLEVALSIHSLICLLVEDLLGAEEKPELMHFAHSHELLRSGLI